MTYNRRIYYAFMHSQDCDLRDVYYSFSREKENAMKYCRQREYECKSLDGVITSYCKTNFTYSFSCKDKDGILWLIHITKSHDYAIPMELLEQDL